MNTKPKRCSRCKVVKERDEFVDYQGMKNPSGRYCKQCHQEREAEIRYIHFDGILSAEQENIEKYKIIFGEDWESKAWPSCLRFYLFMEREFCPYCGRSFKEYQERKDYFECSEKFHIDHMDPLELGGEDTIKNAVSVCKECNLQKGTNLFLAWLERLGPQYRELSRKIYTKKHGHPPEEFVLGESNVKSRTTGSYYLLSFGIEKLIEMKKKNQLE